MIENIKGVLIDLDGTLVDTLNLYKEVNKITIKELYNIDIPDEELYDSLGSSPNELFDNIFKKYGINDNINNFLRVRNKKFLENINRIKLNKGAIELLNFLKENNKKIGIVTTSNKEITYSILNKIGLENIFDIIITYDDVKNPKPDPEGYLLAMKKLNLLPHQCLAIEDSIYGVLSAKRAGIMVFAVTSGADKAKDLKSIKPDKIFKNLLDIYKFLKQDLENYNSNNNDYNKKNQ